MIRTIGAFMIEDNFMKVALSNKAVDGSFYELKNNFFKKCYHMKLLFYPASILNNLSNIAKNKKYPNKNYGLKETNIIQNLQKLKPNLIKLVF